PPLGLSRWGGRFCTSRRTSEGFFAATDLGSVAAKRKSATVVVQKHPPHRDKLGGGEEKKCDRCAEAAAPPSLSRWRRRPSAPGRRRAQAFAPPTQGRWRRTDIGQLTNYELGDEPGGVPASAGPPRLKAGFQRLRSSNAHHELFKRS